MVKFLLLASFSLLTTCPFSSTFAEESGVRYCSFIYSVSSTDSTALEVGFSIEPVTVLVGKSHTMWVQLSNYGEIPVDAVILPIDISMERKNSEKNEWEPLEEEMPWPEEDGSYLSSGVKGFHPMTQIDLMTIDVLEEGRKWYSSCCVPPVYMLRVGMSVILKQDLTFLKEGLWRLSYNINGEKYYQYITSTEENR